MFCSRALPDTNVLLSSSSSISLPSALNKQTKHASSLKPSYSSHFINSLVYISVSFTSLWTTESASTWHQAGNIIGTEGMCACQKSGVLSSPFSLALKGLPAVILKSHYGSMSWDMILLRLELLTQLLLGDYSLVLGVCCFWDFLSVYKCLASSSLKSILLSREDRAYWE